MIRFNYVVVALILLALASCNGCNKTKSREKPDVSNINFQLQFLRFDHDLQDFKNKDFEQQQEYMRNRYGEFYDFYVDQFVIGPRQPGDTADISREAISKFIADPYVNRIQDSIDNTFADTKQLEADLKLSLKYLKYYFPKITLPKVVTVYSMFSNGAFTYGEETLGVGLDCYLGENNPDYDSAQIYQYVRHKMKKEFVVRNAMEVLYNLYFGVDPNARKTFGEAMVEKGKKLYVLSYLLPEAPDSLLVGYTAAQTEWCEKSEHSIWQFFNDKDLLYKEDYMDQKRYLDEGPGAQGMPAEAPGNVGSWVGLQIVRKFMESSGGKISLQDLVLKYDTKTIFEKSHYRP
ncbi:MAG: hypothetical protein U0V74_11730 [Chitinophagales bacterium]